MDISSVIHVCTFSFISSMSLSSSSAKSVRFFYYKCRKISKLVIVHAFSVMPNTTVFVFVEHCFLLNFYDLTGWKYRSQFRPIKSIYRNKWRLHFGESVVRDKLLWQKLVEIKRILYALKSEQIHHHPPQPSVASWGPHAWNVSLIFIIRSGGSRRLWWLRDF